MKADKKKAVSRLLSFALFLLVGSLGLVPQAAQAAPTVLHISWDHPKKIQRNIVLAHGDASVWTFTAELDDDVVMVDGPHWSHSDSTGGVEGGDTTWGSWNDDGLALVWSAPNTGGQFVVSVSGRIRHKGTGVGDGEGPVEEKDFSATWKGKDDGPHDPLKNKCSNNNSSGGCSTCPCTGTDTSNGDTTLGHPDIGGLGMVGNAGSGSALLSSDWTMAATAAGLNLHLPGGCVLSYAKPSGSDTFQGANGDQTTVVENEEDGGYDVIYPDGSRKHFGPAPTGMGMRAMGMMGFDEEGEEEDDNGTTHVSSGASEEEGPSQYLLSETDAYGNVTTYERDEDGKLLSVTDATGHTTTITYDENGRVTQIEDAFGRTLSYTYDSSGRIATETDYSGQEFSYEYDADGRVTSRTDALGTTHYSYEGGDDTGDTGYSAPGQPLGHARRTTIEYADGSKEEYFYDGYGNTWYVSPRDYVEYTPEHNNASEDVPKTLYKYETIAGQTKLTQVTSPSGAKTTYQYDDETGYLLSTTDALDNDSSITYNSKGNPLTATGPDGKTLTLVYAANGQDVVEVKDPENNTVATYTYNDNHQVLTSTDAENHTTTTTYTDWGDVETVTDANGKTTTYHYDEDRLVTSVDFEGDTLNSYTYDSRQRIRTETDATGLTLTYDYDDADRVTKVTYPDDTYEETSYAACCGAMGDKPAHVTDRSGRSTEYDYDEMGRLSRVTDNAGNQVEYQYDANGNMTRLVDSKDNATRFEYDSDGQLSKKIYADDTYELYTYNDGGQLVGKRDAKGNVANYEYDEAGRITKIDYPTLHDVTYTYDGLGRIATSTDGIGTSSYAYDNLNRVASIDGPWDDDTISYTYDALGRRTALGINGTTQASYGYDDMSRLTSVTNGSNSFGYSYNGASSQLTQLTLPGGDKTNYTYDDMQRLTGVQSLKSDNTTNISDFEYGYNNRDVRTSVEKTLGAGSTQTVNYTYDDIDQLTAEVSTETTPLLNKTYAYDDMGNRTSASASGTSTTYTANNLNQVTQTTVGGVDTDITYDANGNTIAIGAKQFNYDEADRLTAVVVPGDKKSEFVYDSDGRKRIAKEYTWNAAAGGGAGAWEQSDETRFVYDGMDLVQERAADGSVKASYVRDGNIGGVLSMTNADGTFYYHYDGNGNVVALTDAAQNIVAQYSYDAYGNLLSSSGSEAAKNPFRFSSKYYDADTGLYDYGLRHYDSALGRWINRDPIKELGGINVYQFVGNDTVNLIDSYGLALLPGGIKLPNGNDGIVYKPIERGRPPLDINGTPIELHHRDQNPDGPLDEMLKEKHRGKGNHGKNHPKRPSRIDRNRAKEEREDHWECEWDKGRFKDLPDYAPEPTAYEKILINLPGSPATYELLGKASGVVAVATSGTAFILATGGIGALVPVAGGAVRVLAH